jgi:hypothetical protein
VEHQFSVAETVFADMNKRVEIGGISDWVSGSEGDEADHVVSGIEQAGNGAFECGHGSLQDWQSGHSGRAVDTGKGVGIGVKALSEVSKQQCVAFLDLIESDGCSRGQPVDEPAGFVDGHRHLGRVEGGLLDPAGEQSGFFAIRPCDCHDEDSAGDASEDLSEERCFRGGFGIFGCHWGWSGRERQSEISVAAIVAVRRMESSAVRGVC